MHKTKNTLTLILMTMLALNAFAGINAPSEIVSNANWGFSVTADSTKDIFFDNAKIVTVYSNGQAIKDPLSGSQVLDAFVFDKTLFVSLMGTTTGTHTISTSDGENFSLTAISPSGQQLSDEINSKFEEITQANEQLTRQVNTLEQDMLAKDQKIEELRSLLEQANANIEQTKNSIEQTAQQQSTQKDELKQELAGVTSRVDKLDEKVFPKPVEAKEQQAPFAPVTGLAVFAQKNWIGLFLVLLAATLTVFFISRKKTVAISRGKSVYEDFDRLYEPSLGNTKSYQEIKDAEKTKETLDQKGKWAAKE